MRYIAVGIGNPILGDDGIGLHVVREVIKRIAGSYDPSPGGIPVEVKVKEDLTVVLDEAYTGGMNLLDLILGFDRAVLIDAVSESGLEPGEVRRMDLDDMITVHSTNPHDTSLAEAVKLAKDLGEDRVPPEIMLVGINIKPSGVFSEGLSHPVREAIPEAVRLTLFLLGFPSGEGNEV